jgi:hypothetical protein
LKAPTAGSESRRRLGALAGRAAAAALFLAFALEARAQPLPPANMAGWEIRGTLRGSYATWEDHLWRFQGATRVTGHMSAQVTYSLGRGGTRLIQDSDLGFWRVADGTLCIQWRKWYRARTLCWRLEARGGQRVRFVGQGGTPSFTGTLARYRE